MGCVWQSAEHSICLTLNSDVCSFCTLWQLFIFLDISMVFTTVWSFLNSIDIILFTIWRAEAGYSGSSRPIPDELMKWPIASPFPVRSLMRTDFKHSFATFSGWYMMKIKIYVSINITLNKWNFSYSIVNHMYLPPWATMSSLHFNISDIYSIYQEICTRFCCALLCCGYAIVHNEFRWSIYPNSSGLLWWHWGNREIATVPVK